MEPGQEPPVAFQRMSTAAINSAAGHRQGATKKDGKKNSVSRTSKLNMVNGVSATQSLMNDESILSQQHTGKGINHNSLIVDSVNNRMTGDVSILSQERYNGTKKNRGANAMSELRKSSKMPINSKKY